MDKEKWKIEAIFIGRWFQTIILGLVIVLLVMGIWTLWSWRGANNMVGATQAKLDVLIGETGGLVAELRAKVKEVDAGKLNAIGDGLKARVDDAGKMQEQLTGFIADARLQGDDVTKAAVARMNQLGQNLGSLQALTDEGRAQLKQGGDALTKTVLSVDRLVADNTPHVTNASAALERGMNGLATIIQTSDPRVAELLGQLKTVLISADGTVKSFTPVGNNLAGITDDFHSMTTDSKNKLHSIFYPEPVKGFWPNVKRVASFVITPAFEGTRLYFSLRALPVKVTQPIPPLP
jgi:hypothetical protein